MNVNHLRVRRENERKVTLSLLASLSLPPVVLQSLERGRRKKRSGHRESLKSQLNSSPLFFTRVLCVLNSCLFAASCVRR